jgi:hypothetical protein
VLSGLFYDAFRIPIHPFSELVICSTEFLTEKYFVGDKERKEPEMVSKVIVDGSIS